MKSSITVEVNNLELGFKTQTEYLPVLQDINLEVKAGEFLVLLGPSGCGKSSLLNAIAGFIQPVAGSLLHEGKTITDVNRHVGYLTQDDTLLPWRTVEENISIPLELRMHKDQSAERSALVSKYIDLVGLKGFEKYHPNRLSGGMRKRVALARTLIYQPDLLLMDEPFGALDAQLKIVMQNELLRVWETTKKTIIFVTHDLAEALVLADRIVVFSRRPGRIKEIVKVDLPRPRKAAEIQLNPQYGALFQKLWGLLDGASEAVSATD